MCRPNMHPSNFKEANPKAKNEKTGKGKTKKKVQLKRT